MNCACDRPAPPPAPARDRVLTLYPPCARPPQPSVLWPCPLREQGALSCKDVVLLIADLLGTTHHECLEQLCNHMGVPVPELPSESSGSDDDDEPWTHLPVSEMDLTPYDQCTPSYRAFPSERPKDRCTVRVPVEAAMLNDDWVSVPTGSEEDFFFKTT